MASSKHSIIAISVLMGVMGFILSVSIVTVLKQAAIIEQQHNDIVEANRKVMDIQATCFKYEMEIMSLLPTSAK